MKIKKILTCLFILLSVHTFCQTKKQYIQAGDKNFKQRDYYGAIIHYKNALAFDEMDLALLYKYAQALRLDKNYKQAELYYQKIYSKDGGREYPKAVFWLASMQKYNGKYIESYKTWKHVKTLFRRRNSYENKKAKQEIKSIAYSRRSEKYRTEAKVKSIGDGVNTTDSEFNPIVKNGKLYFTSLRANKKGGDRQILDELYKLKLYVALQKDSIWETKEDLPFVINSPQYHQANCCFNPEGNKFYFSRCNEDNQCKIMVSEFKNDSWSTPKELNLNQSNSTTTQPMSCTVKGEEYLFFVSNRKGGIGKLDIWFAKRNSDNEFNKPINAGKKVNSIDNEITPFYDSDNRMLYFSSNWHSGIGGFDIFKSSGKPTRLGRPKNLGVPINSRWNDLYYVIDTASKTNYFASNREESRSAADNVTCCNDIYSVQFPEPPEPKEIEILTLEDLNKYLPVTLYFHNDCPNPRTTKKTTELNYMNTYKDYLKLIPTYKNEYSKGLGELKKEEAILDIDDFFKDYVNKGVEDLKLFTELLYLELQKGTAVEVTVKGFASPLAKTDYNVKLAGRRISSLENYLREVDNGKFLSFFDEKSEKLTIKQVPFGEYKASELVSDNLNDKRNSVYSRAAAMERKIEVQSVNLLRKIDVDSLPIITLDKETIDKGLVKNGIPIPIKFTMKNEGNSPLEIYKMVGSCSCTVIKNGKTILLPGETRVVNAEINTEQLFGKYTKTITIYSNAQHKSKEVVITFEIIENK